MNFLLLFVAAYLLGSVPFAVIVSKLFGLSDPRRYGSGNPGATNVLRSGSKAAAALTLVGDTVKGFAAVWIATMLGFSPFEAGLIGFAAFLGHIFSIFLRFRGGKGVATALGVVAGMSGWVALCALAVWLTMLLVSRYSSLAGLTAAVVTPIAGVFLLGDGRVGILLAIALLMAWRHRSNIRKLFSGTESKIGTGKG